MNPIEQNMEAIKQLCEKHKVNTLFAFGSVLNEKFNEDSDIDLLVTFADVDLNQYADNYYNLFTSFESLFGRKVDLIEEKVLKNPYLLKSINRNRKRIYERRNPGLAA